MASTPTPPRPKAHGERSIWRSRWYDDKGERHDKTFGYTDEVTERQAKSLYKSWLNQWRLSDRAQNPKATQYNYTAAELAVEYLEYAKVTFVKDGAITSTVWNVQYAMQDFADAFGTRPISSIENPDLARLRDAMIWGVGEDGEPKARSVKTVNGRLFIIKAAYEWARDRGLVTAQSLYDVMHVKRLVPGRSAAIDPKPIQAIDEHWVAVIKDVCTAPLKAMIDLQWLTGMRPGEVVIMRGIDIDASGKVWLYTPRRHKMEHKDKVRIIPLGPQAQAIIQPFLNRDSTAELFSPHESETERRAARTAARTTPKERGNAVGTNRATRPRWSPGSCYTTQSYRKAIHHACRKVAEKNPNMPEWNPNQLRHAAATRLNKMFGLEDVSITLGHSDTATTRIYAQPDVSKAIEIALRVG